MDGPDDRGHGITDIGERIIIRVTLKIFDWGPLLAYRETVVGTGGTRK